MPTVNKLSTLAVKAALKAGPGAGKAKRISDGDGLFLEVRPGGVGWWRLRYFFQGKERMLSLGTFPEVSLAAARERRDAARQQVAAGRDPSDARKAEKAIRQQAQAEQALLAAGKPLSGNFEFVAREWLTNVHEATVSAGHAARTRIRFEQDAFPWLGSRPLADIEAPEVLTCLRRVISRGAIETAHRLKDACGYHLTHHLLPAVPYYRLPQAQRIFERLPSYQARGVGCHCYVAGAAPVARAWQARRAA